MDVIFNEMDKKKIVIYNEHFAQVDEDVLIKLEEYLNDLSKKTGRKMSKIDWIKQECEEHLGCSLKCKQDIKRISEKVKEHHYLSKAEWLRDRIRVTINS